MEDLEEVWKFKYMGSNISVEGGYEDKEKFGFLVKKQRKGLWRQSQNGRKFYGSPFLNVQLNANDAKPQTTDQVTGMWFCIIWVEGWQKDIVIWSAVGGL